MEAKELRIGNRINENISGIDGIVTWELIRIIEDKQEHSYRPIILTEEWLTKLGFEKTDIDSENIGSYTNNIVWLNYYKKQADVRGYWLRHYQGIKNSKLQYVHQLQNLYFALTGEELKLSE